MIQNQTELRAELDERSKRTLGNAAADKYIALAEKRIVRAFAKSGIMNRLIAVKTLTASGTTVSMPTGCRGIEALYLDINPKQELRYLAPPAFFSRYISSDTGKPKGYTIQGGVIHLGPAPDQSYSIQCWFRQSLDIAGRYDQLLIPYQDETDYVGNIVGGTGHAINDIITLESGRAQVYVTGISGSAVNGFDIIEVDNSNLVDWGQTLSQSSTTGSGTGFEIVLDDDNISNLIIQDHPELYIEGAMIEFYKDTRNQAQMQTAMTEFYSAVEDLADEAFNLGGALKMYNQQSSAGAPRLSR